MQMALQAALVALALAAAPAANAWSATGTDSVRASFRSLQTAAPAGAYSGDVDPPAPQFIRPGHPNDGNEGNEGNEGKARGTHTLTVHSVQQLLSDCIPIDYIEYVIRMCMLKAPSVF
jgi:hypothetical protein